MASPSIIDLLNDHVDSLNRGQDKTAELTATFGELHPGLPHLLRIGLAIKQALVPVSPRPEFVARLAESLREGPVGSASRVPARRRQSALVGLAAVGSILSLVGLLLLRLRRSNALERQPA